MIWKRKDGADLENTSTFKKYRVPILIVALLAFAVACVLSVFANSDTKVNKSATNSFTPAEIEVAVTESGIDSSSYADITEKTNTVTWSEDTSTDENGSKVVSYTASKPVEITTTSAADSNYVKSYVRVALVPRYVTTLTTTSEYEDENSETQTSTSEIDVDIQSGDAAEYGLESFDELTAVTDSDSLADGTATSFTNGDVTFTLADGWHEYWFYNSTDGYFYYKTAVEAGDSTEQLLASVTISSDTYAILEEYGITLQIDVLTDAIQTEGGAVDARWSNVSIDENSSLVQATTATAATEEATETTDDGTDDEND